MRHLAALAFLAVAVMGLSPLALADGPPEGPVHVALGDSQAFGVGATLPDKLGYAAVLNRWIHAHDCREGNPAACPGLEFTNLAIPGATSSTLIADQLQPAVELISERNVDDVAGNEVVLITLTIGGNDIVNPVLAACAGGQTPECAQVIANTFSSYTTNLTVILQTLRTAAGPDTQIVISTYDNPLAACFRAPIAPLGDLVLEGGPGLPLGFNDIIRNVAAGFDVDVADTFGQLGLEDWVGGEDCTHPDNSGHRRMAEIFRAVID